VPRYHRGPVQLELLRDSVQVLEVHPAVVRDVGFVRGPEPREIRGHDVEPTRDPSGEPIEVAT
jgi:hypothetical protein